MNADQIIHLPEISDIGIRPNSIYYSFDSRDFKNCECDESFPIQTFEAERVEANELLPGKLYIFTDADENVVIGTITDIERHYLILEDLTQEQVNPVICLENIQEIYLVYRTSIQISEEEWEERLYPV